MNSWPSHDQTHGKSSSAKEGANSPHFMPRFYFPKPTLALLQVHLAHPSPPVLKHNIYRLLGLNDPPKKGTKLITNGDHNFFPPKS